MKTELRPQAVSASSLGYAAACAARFAFPLPHLPGDTRVYEPGGGGSAAARGTFVHKVLELRVKGYTLPEALSAAREGLGRREHWQWTAWASAHDPSDLLPPGYTWVPEQRWEVTVGPLLVGGTPDVAGTRGSDGYVVDWKTQAARGSGDAMPAAWTLARAELDAQKAANHRLQAAFHALAMLEAAPQVRAVTTDIVGLGPPAAKGERGQVWGEQRLKVERGGETHTNIVRRLEQVTSRVAAARALPDPHAAARPGLYCRYCPAGERNGGPCTRSREVVAPWPGG